MNIELLREKMDNKGVDVSVLAREIGVDKSTVYRKISKAGEPFTIKEANKIVHALGLSGKDAKEIFFD